MNTSSRRAVKARREGPEVAHLGRACLSCATHVQQSASGEPGFFLCSACVATVNGQGLPYGDRLRALWALCYGARAARGQTEGKGEAGASRP